jgi:hypothetical protein
MVLRESGGANESERKCGGGEALGKIHNSTPEGLAWASALRPTVEQTAIAVLDFKKSLRFILCLRIQRSRLLIDVLRQCAVGSASTTSWRVRFAAISAAMLEHANT